MHLLAKTLHGSRMYGLDNAKSDWDWKQIHLPAREECYLLKAPRNVHTEEIVNEVKVEAESFALQEFLALACRGEDVAITTLHAPDSAVTLWSPEFRELRANRKRFHTSKMAGMCGFSRSMAAKYGLRADRMETVEKVIEVLKRMIEMGVAKLSQEWDMLPDLPHTRRFINPADRNADKRIYEVVSKGLPAPIAPSYALEVMEKARDSYGERVKTARGMGNTDLKAVSHSFRVAYQLKHLFTEGDFSFPLPETPFIRAVKEGTLNYVTDGLDAKLNDLITEIEELSAKSTLPERVDTKWCDSLVLAAYGA